MRRLSQVLLMGTALIGLLSVPAITKAFTAKTDSTPPAIADSTQVMQINSAGIKELEMIEQRNKEIVQSYFDRWRNNTGNFFDLLAPEATWTITGTGATAGTYRRQAFLDQVVQPANARFLSPLVPTVDGIWADDDMVIVLWDGATTAKDGQPYRNTYTWYFRMKDGKAIEAIAFLDMHMFNDLWTRISPTP
ncbi:MAG: nuclear transport factor 2 family protein [Synechococcales cyanobacterium RM1_1_8]|nr:nuclear transport factor 2 family protein [Synechococcales cyanobacterium RM1_1_8]